MALQGFLSSIRQLPARSAGFVGSAGPVALLGVDLGRKGGTDAILEQFRLQVSKRPTCEAYCDVDLHPPGTKISCPPATSNLLPVLECGTLVPDEGDSPGAVHQAIASLTANTFEKGYIPLIVGDSPRGVTLPALEGIKSVSGEDPVVVHFGADTGLEKDDSPLYVALEKGLIRGVMQFGTRCINRHARHARVKHSVRYVDGNTMHAKGSFTVKDIRNDFPIYLSIDLGVLDPAFAPGVVAPEPAGLTVRELVHLLSVLRGPNIVGMDLCGYHPDNDVYRGRGELGGSGLTSCVGGKLVRELILKAYAMTTKSQAEMTQHINEERRAGNHPDKPDF